MNLEGGQKLSENVIVIGGGSIGADVARTAVRCGATKVDAYLCIGCGQCTTKCKFDAIHLVKKYDMWGGSFEALPIAVAKHVVKRSANIAANAVKGVRQ